MSKLGEIGFRPPQGGPPNWDELLELPKKPSPSDDKLAAKLFLAAFTNGLPETQSGTNDIISILQRFIGLETDAGMRDGQNELLEVVAPIIEKLVNEREMANKGWNRWVYLRNEQYERAEKLVKERDTAREQRDHWVRLHEAMAECVAILRYFDSDVQSNGVVSYQWNKAKREALAKLDALKGGQV